MSSSHRLQLLSIQRILLHVPTHVYPQWRLVFLLPVQGPVPPFYLRVLPVFLLPDLKTYQTLRVLLLVPVTTRQGPKPIPVRRAPGVPVLRLDPIITVRCNIHHNRLLMFYGLSLPSPNVQCRNTFLRERERVRVRVREREFLPSTSVVEFINPSYHINYYLD